MMNYKYEDEIQQRLIQNYDSLIKLEYPTKAFELICILLKVDTKEVSKISNPGT